MFVAKRGLGFSFRPFAHVQTTSRAIALVLVNFGNEVVMMSLSYSSSRNLFNIDEL